MKLRTKLIIVSATAILGGFGLASATGYPAVFNATDTADTTQSQPADQSATNQTATPVDTTASQPTDNQGSSASITSGVPTNSPASKPAPQPQPKPATIYSDHYSADTPCRLRTENTYTNDCGTTTQQPTTQSAPVTDTTTPDPATPVSNDNNTVSNPNQ